LPASSPNSQRAGYWASSFGVRALPTFTTGRKISFRVKPQVGTLSLGSFHFGCNSSGAGPYLRIDARGSACGVGTAGSWRSLPGPGQATHASLATGTWYLVEIEMTSPTAGLWKLDGVTVGTFTVSILGTYIGFNGWADVLITPPLWDSLESSP
jgi:hypothetical protein